jgi:hypothetical protein
VDRRLRIEAFADREGATEFGQKLGKAECRKVHLPVSRSGDCRAREARRRTRASDDVLRRFSRSWNNFTQIYRLLADVWSVYDNSGSTPVLIKRSS